MKVFKNLSTYILALGFSATLFSGCEDYLNVSDDLAAEMTMEEVMHVGFIATSIRVFPMCQISL